jgi:hypothetical protein
LKKGGFGEKRLKLLCGLKPLAPRREQFVLYILKVLLLDPSEIYSKGAEES